MTVAWRPNLGQEGCYSGSKTNTYRCGARDAISASRVSLKLDSVSKGEHLNKFK